MSILNIANEIRLAGEVIEFHLPEPKGLTKYKTKYLYTMSCKTNVIIIKKLCVFQIPEMAIYFLANEGKNIPELQRELHAIVVTTIKNY